MKRGGARQASGCVEVSTDVSSSSSTVRTACVFEQQVAQSGQITSQCKCGVSTSLTARHGRNAAPWSCYERASSIGCTPALPAAAYVNASEKGARGRGDGERVGRVINDVQQEAAGDAATTRARIARWGA